MTPVRRSPQRTAIAAVLALGCAGLAGAPTPDHGAPPAVSVTPSVESRPGMVALGERDALARFFTVMGARKPSRLAVTRVVGTRALTLDAPDRDGLLAIWVRQRCQYRIPLDEPPVETALPCVFACRYPAGSDDTVEAEGCSFRIP